MGEPKPAAESQPHVPDREALLEASSENLRLAYSRIQDVNLALREGMFKLSFGAMIALGVADGWFVGSDKLPSRAVSCAVIVGLWILGMSSVVAIRAQYREYLASAAMIVRIERALGFYDRGSYVAGDTLYEASSKEWGSGKYSNHIFVGQVFAVIVFTLFSMVLVGLSEFAE